MKKGVGRPMSPDHTTVGQGAWQLLPTNQPQRDSPSKWYSLSHKLKVKVYKMDSTIPTCISQKESDFRLSPFSLLLSAKRDSFALFWCISLGSHIILIANVIPWAGFLCLLYYFKSILDCGSEKIRLMGRLVTCLHAHILKILKFYP